MPSIEEDAIKAYDECVEAVSQAITKWAGGFSTKFIVAAQGVNENGNLVQQVFAPDEQTLTDSMGLSALTDVVFRTRMTLAVTSNLWDEYEDGDEGDGE